MQAMRCSGKWVNELWLWNILEQSDMVIVWWLFSEQMAFTRICSHLKKKVRKIETKNNTAKRIQWWCKLNASWGWFIWNHGQGGVMKSYCIFKVGHKVRFLTRSTIISTRKKDSNTVLTIGKCISLNPEQSSRNSGLEKEKYLRSSSKGPRLVKCLCYPACPGASTPSLTSRTCLWWHTRPWCHICLWCSTHAYDATHMLVTSHTYLLASLLCHILQVLPISYIWTGLYRSRLLDFHVLGCLPWLLVPLLRAADVWFLESTTIPCSPTDSLLPLEVLPREVGNLGSIASCRWVMYDSAFLINVTRLITWVFLHRYCIFCLDL